MKGMGRQDITQGKHAKTTIPDKKFSYSLDIGVFRRKSAFGEPPVSRQRTQ